MKNLTLNILLILFCSNFALAQDTTIVQTLDFNDITKRRGWYIFPQDTTYEKVLMYYTLKCDAATTQDNFACGEWDYTTYTNLYEHNNVGSSRYLVNGTYPDTINYLNTPTYTYYEQNQYFIVYDAVTSESNYTIGTGTNSTIQTLNATNENNKAQYLWTVAELTGAGLTAGNIDKLKIDITTLGSNLNYLSVKMKNSALTSLSETSYETTGLSEVYLMNTQFASTGTDSINLTTPFNWDGTSNIAIDFSFNNSTPGSGYVLNGTTTASNMGVHSTQEDGYLKFEWGDYVNVPATALANINNEVTISFWQYGDPDKQPQNSYIFEGRDANGYRVLNAHLPWSNSRVYWDAGNSGTNSYDRVDDLANFADFAGQWNHWAFTKNQTTGSMKVYLNGNLFSSGTGKNRTMGGITEFKIGGRAGSGFYGRYDGSINNFEIWNKELSQTDIQNWMNKDIDPSHPFYSNLQAYYKFDDMTGTTAVDASGNGNSGNLIGLPSWKLLKGNELNRNLSATNERPNITFTQGVYTTHIDSSLTTDSIMNSPISIIQYGTSLDINVTGISETPIDTTFAWYSGWSFTYDQNGIKVDSVFMNNTNQLVNNYNTTTFQLQNYVTPYGIGLDLGPNGFRWVYDVTDYQRLLHDTVEISAGNQQELIDVKFMMIKGTPPRDVIKMEQVWLGDYQHSDIANDIVMPAVNIDLDPTASSFRIKTRTSGHWFGGFENCAEFCPKLHHLDIDGTQRFQWNNWKSDCAENPVIDQGGTWIYDRAGWCPGTFTDTYDHELTTFVTPGTTFSLDYGMQTTAGGMEGNYRTSVQLVSYGANNFNLDARVEEIISPNDWEQHDKVNPICADPKIVIQNTGSTALTSLTITYKIEGGSSESYTWNGNLDFMEKEEVTLPISSQSFWATSSSNNIFEVTVSGPNGGVDEYSKNNTATSTFERPEAYSGKFLIELITNSAASENSYTIKDDQGNIVMSRSGMSNTTIYRDTVDLPNGCYVLDFIDSGEDGLSFFANNDGNGSLKFQWIDGTPWIKTFNSNFGSNIKYYFSVGFTAGVDPYSQFQEVLVSPNPSHDIFNVSISGFENETVNVGIYNIIGEVLMTESATSVNNSLKTSFDLSDVPNGIYFVRVFGEESYTVKKIIKN
ncbi:MAG: peptide-N-glycosidase F-related protein [Vicingaceae bacterium]|nr:peptide-N-glycosidase F-related protein [Vicingaceae bacterium]